MCLDMFLQILGTFERLSAEFALVRFERDVDSDVRGDVVAFDSGGATGPPLAGQVEVICALTADVTLADMVLNFVSFCCLIFEFVHAKYSRQYSRKGLQQWCIVHRNPAIDRPDSPTP